MNRYDVIVTVLKPDGGYAIYNVPPDHITEVRDDGTAILLDKTAAPEIGDDIAADLRNYECSCGSTTCRACTAADEIERLRDEVDTLRSSRNLWQNIAGEQVKHRKYLELLGKAAEAYEMGLIGDGDRLMQRAEEIAP